MKKIKIILVFLGVVFLVNSCNESDLELTNPNQLSPETFFKNESQLQASVNAIYANLQTIGMYSRHMFFMMDNMAHENSGNPQLEADKVEYLNFSFDSSHGGIGDYWNSCFRGINKANFVLNNQEAIAAIPQSFLNQARKDKYLGEAKFLRGLYYFYLVSRFGDVPLIIEIPENGEGVTRTPKEEVYAQIITDLQEAAATLLDKETEESGRATKGAAYALLGKVYLYQQNYGAAMEAFSNVTGYTLEDNYEDNFFEETEHGPESIFEVEFNDDLGDGAKWNSNVSGAGPNEVTFRGQEYGMFDWFNIYPSDNLLDEYEDGDIRFDETFYVVGDTTGAGVAITSIANDRRAGWRKYQNYYKEINEDQASGINMKVLRYADVLLMMAECANEIESQSTAIGYINQVRERADLSDLDTGLSKQQVFEAIVHERKVELAGEQVRFADLVRWGMASDVLGQFGFQSGKSELLPIPDSEISSNANISAADQNPGY